jgi:hypothetical protein
MILEILATIRLPSNKFEMVFAEFPLKPRVTFILKQIAMKTSLRKMETENSAKAVFLLGHLSSELEIFDNENPIVELQLHPWGNRTDLNGLCERRMGKTPT